MIFSNIIIKKFLNTYLKIKLAKMDDIFKNVGSSTRRDISKKKIKVKKYYKYLDKTIYIIVGLSVLLLGILIFLWDFYIPSKKNLAIKVNFLDNRDPSSVTPPSTTNQDLSQKSVGSNNYQSSQDPSGLTSPNNGAGNYDRAQLKQFCSMTDTSSAINFPGQFKYQQCDTGLICTPNILKEGPICLADLDQLCNNLSDCVPGTDACISGRCALIDVDNKINTICDDDTDCILNDFEDQINNHICYKLPGQIKGFCKFSLFPFDGGCRNNSECPTIANHQIKCIQNNNYSDTLMTGTIICDNGGDCLNGKGLSLQFDDKFNMEYLQGANGVFMVNILPQNYSIKDIYTESQQYTISNEGSCFLTNTVLLDRLTFNNYDPQGLSPVYISFGDLQRPESLIDNTGGPYGICLDLLPVGSPSDFKLANVTIPSINNIPTTSIDNKVVKSSRVNTGKLGDFCLNTASNNSILGCGTTPYLKQNYQMECGYNYYYEEILMDNLYYGLSSPSFGLEYLGSCMLKNTLKNRPCDNANNGCIEPYICLPILDPESNQTTNYCVTSMRSQICEDNNCPAGYKCNSSGSLPFCLSNSLNIALTDGDCYSNSKTTGKLFDIYVYNINDDKYYGLNLAQTIVENLQDSDNLYNINMKLSTDYQTVDSYLEMGITDRTRLPKSILVYGTSNINDNNSTQVIIFNLNGNKYDTDNPYLVKIVPYVGSTIEDIIFAPDNNLAVIQKKTIDGLREIALKVGFIDPYGSGSGTTGASIFLEQPTDWFNFNMLRKDQEYDFYMQSNDTINYNVKFKGIFRITESSISTYQSPAYIDAQEISSKEYFSYDPTDPLQSGYNIFVVCNTNKLAFNNSAYNNTVTSSSVTDIGLSIGLSAQRILLPPGFNTDANISTLGENFFYTPKIYRNSGTGFSPIYESGYTSLETGDRIILDQKMWLLNVNNFSTGFATQVSGENEWGILDIEKDTYLYVTKVQDNYYIKDGNPLVKKDLNNFIINLTTDTLSSEGSVPIFDGTPVYNQNIGVIPTSNNIKDPDQNQGVSFTLYKNMVNYDVTFISTDTTYTGSTFGLSNPSKILEYLRDGNLAADTNYMDNGINNSITYNFEPETDVKFSFNTNDSINYMMIHSAVKGTSTFYNYVQKVQYELSRGSFVTGSADPLGTNTFTVSATDNTDYDYFYKNNSTFNNLTYYNHVKFKYDKQVIAPSPKSLYFDSTRGTTNLINNVQENLFDGDDETFSIFTTFKNDQFIEETGYLPQEVLGINSQNVYSNKAPPIASYSRYDEFEYAKEGDDISINYKNSPLFNTNDGVDILTTIGLSYSTDINCVFDDVLGTNPNTITLRDPDAISVFLNNPSSEIIIQKQGMSLESFYVKNVDPGVSTVLTGADFASKKVNSGGAGNFTNGVGNLYQANQWPPFFAGVGINSPLGYDVTYGSNTTLQNMMQQKFTEITRSIVSIKEYNVYVDEKGDVNEFLVIELNAKIDVNDEYTKMIFNHNGGKGWKLWPYNFAPLSYYNDLNIIAYSRGGDCFVNTAPDFEDEYITIMDGSVLWTGCKGSENVLPEFFNKSSYNKLVFNNGTSLTVYNAFDQYFFKKDIDINGPIQTDIDNNTFFNTSPVSGRRLTAVSNITDFNQPTNFTETSVNVNHISDVVLTPYYTNSGEFVPPIVTTPSGYNNNNLMGASPANIGAVTALNQLGI